MIGWRSRCWTSVLPASCQFNFPFSRPFQHSANSLVCRLIMREVSHFCTFTRFRTAWRVKIYRSISRYPHLMCQGLRFVQPEQWSLWLSFQPSLKLIQSEHQILHLVFRLFCESIAWDEGFFESYQRNTPAFTLTFQFVDCPQLFIMNL